MHFLFISSKCVLNLYRAMNIENCLYVHFCTLLVSRKMSNASLLLTKQSSGSDGEDCPYMYGFVWRQEYLTDVTYPHLVALIVINLLAVLPTVLLNALVIVAVTTRHRLQSNSNERAYDGAGRSRLTEWAGQSRCRNSSCTDA